MQQAQALSTSGRPEASLETSPVGRQTPLRDLTLFARVQDGDRQAFRALFREHQVTVYWAAFSVLRSRPDSEEVLQDAFLTLWNKRASIHPVGESVAPWLVTTARYLALNRRRSELRRPRDSLDTVLELADNGPTPESLAIAREATRHIRGFMANLPEVDQAIFELCLVDDLSYDQVATRLGITHATVRNRLFRLKGRLRHELSPTTAEPESQQARRRRAVVVASAVLLLAGGAAWGTLTSPESQNQFAYCYAEASSESEATQVASPNEQAAVSACASVWATEVFADGTYSGFTPRNDPGTAAAPGSDLPSPGSTGPTLQVCLRPDGAYAVFPLWPGTTNTGDADAFCAAVGLEPPHQP